MPGHALIPPRTGLFGKLPTHGDFVRRGDPAIIARLDDWIMAELSRIAATDPAGLDERIAALPTWRFVVDLGTDRLLGLLASSRDRVGRLFPLLLFHAAPTLSADGVARWADAAASALADAPDADSLHATLVELAALAAPDEDGEDTDPAPSGWWHGTHMLDDAPTTLPTGAAFDRLWHPGSTTMVGGS
jgi:type VI secretion system protein ImpM